MPLEDFFIEALNRHEALLQALEEGTVPTAKLLKEYDRHSRFDALRVSSEYVKDVINREQEANEIFDSQVAARELPD